MPCTSSPRPCGLASQREPWPPPHWRRNSEEADRFPLFSLRHELLEALRAIHQAEDEGAFPAAPPREILDLLNGVGPPLDDRVLPVIESLLGSLWQDGLIGLVPSPSVGHPSRYLIREAAEVALRSGAPVLLRPLRDQNMTNRRPPTPLVELS